ncbi:MAG TPA: hypothetical protein ENH10_05960, partial [Bacteroidetes bacterium]|nr:hypothetical protein [Bacteroidota bacterium]HEX04689.1 hypothetical protein [Bacteroidota bacterium]
MKSSVLYVGLLIALLGLFALSAQAQTVQNGDFENWTDDDPDDWTVVQGAYVTEDAFAISGEASCKLFADDAGDKPRLVQYFSVDPNVEVTAEIFVYDSDDGYVRMNVKVYDEFGVWLQTEFDNSYNSASWQSVSANFITPANADNMKIEIIYYFDQATPGPHTAYVDLCSITSAIPTSPMPLNPGFEDWTAGDPDNWNLVLGGDGAVAEENAIVNSGSASLAIISQPNGYSARAYQLLTGRVGDTVAASVEVMDNDDSFCRLYLVAYSDAIPPIGWSFDFSSNSGSWQTLSTTLTLSASTQYVQVRLIVYPDDAGAADQTIYFDDVDFWIDTYTYDVSDANTWYFFGVPCTIALAGNRNADALFSDDLGGDSEEDTWVMSRYNNTTHVYDRFGNGDGDPGTEPPDIEP